MVGFGPELETGPILPSRGPASTGAVGGAAGAAAFLDLGGGLGCPARAVPAGRGADTSALGFLEVEADAAAAAVVRVTKLEKKKKRE